MEHERIAKVTRKGLNVTIRPVRPGDEMLYRTLFASLSDDSIHQRFLTALKEPPKQVLEWFSAAPPGHASFAAMLKDAASGEERMVGVAHLCGEEEPDTAEFAVLVGDAWQGQGVGAELMLRCLGAAHKLGFHRVRGWAMPRNSRMIALAKALGFSVRLDPDLGLVLMEWDIPHQNSVDVTPGMQTSGGPNHSDASY